LYQDGFVRIGYDRVNTFYLRADDEVVSFNDLEALLWKEWKQSRSLRHSNEIQDPMVHVRNQFKEAIVAMVDNFRNTTFAPINREKDFVEDGFELMSADFTIDRDLDVHLMATYSDTDPAGFYAPFLLEDYYFLVQNNHELWYSMMLTMEEVWDKQERQLNSVLPLLTTGKFQLIVAGADWKFQYKLGEKDSKSPSSKKEKKRKKKATKCTVHKNRKQFSSALRIVAPPQVDEDAIGEGYGDDTNETDSIYTTVVMTPPDDPVEIPY